MSLRNATTAEVFDLAQNGKRQAIGRLLSLTERGGSPADEVADFTHPLAGKAHIIGITGAPGAGKSTLTGQLTAHMGRLGLTAAVLAVDPSSPLTGGAILGDRIRMDDVTAESTFIRSMATRGHSGGLALAVPGAVRVFDALDFDPVVIETVGVGQVEVDVAGTADTTVVVVTPGWGDAVQANKAGLLEVADIFVVNKSDRPGANDARRDLELMLDLSHVTGQQDDSGYRPPIIMTNALDGTGAEQVWDAVQAHRQVLQDHDQLTGRRAQRTRQEIQNRLEQILGETAEGLLDSTAGQAILDETQAKRTSPSLAARTLADTLLGRS